MTVDAARSFRLRRVEGVLHQLGARKHRPGVALRAELIAVASVIDVDLERELARRSVREMTAGAGDGAGLEATAQGECLVAVETIRPAVGPELALQIVVRNRIADEERQRVILLVIARLEADE